MATLGGLLTMQEAFMARVAASPAATRKKALWRQNGARYLAPYASMPQGSLVTVDPTLQRRVLEYIEAVFPAVADSFNRHLGPVAEKAFTDWPVLTGVSKSLLSLRFDLVNETTIRGSLNCTAPYSYFINKGATVRELVFKPGEDAATAMANELVNVLADT